MSQDHVKFDVRLAVVRCSHCHDNQVWLLQGADLPRQSISFGGLELGGPSGTPVSVAAGGAPPGLVTVQGRRIDEAGSHTPCLPSVSPAGQEMQVTPQLPSEPALRQGAGEVQAQELGEPVAEVQHEGAQAAGTEAMDPEADAAENLPDAVMGAARNSAAGIDAEDGTGAAGEKQVEGVEGHREGPAGEEDQGPSAVHAADPADSSIPSEMVSDRNTPVDRPAAVGGVNGADPGMRP